MGAKVYVKNGASYTNPYVKPLNGAKTTYSPAVGGINYQTDPRFTASGINYQTDPRFIGTEEKKETPQYKKQTLPATKQAQLDAYDAFINAPAPTDIKTTVKPKTTSVGSVGYSAGNFAPSQAYLAAMDYTNQLLEQLSSGRTAYTDKINSLMDQISNREDFSYDPDTDTLFQNSLAGAMNKGQVAMQNTMGQAAALTGGYGSTYATSAANQAYNAYIQDAYASLPDYYSMALNAYNAEGQDMYNQLGMYQAADQSEYDRMAAAYTANLQNASMMYDQEYNNYWQTQNFNRSSQQWADEMAYKNAQAAQSQANWEKEYSLDLEKAKSSGSTASGITDTQRKTAFSNVLTSANKWGLGSDKFAESAATIANQYGLSLDELLDYAETNMDNPTYTLGLNGYTDQWGGINSAEPIFTLVETKTDQNNNVYKDQYGTTYTRVQLKQMGYEFDSKGKVKTKG